MYIVIAGGGKIGYYLAKTLLPNKHRVLIIEPQKDLCMKIANELNIPVLNGDATTLESLLGAETEKADVFISVIGRDEDNLISCQLAKRKFNVKRTIARVNNPKNIAVFEKLGVDSVMSGTSVIADLIEQEVDYEGMKTLANLKGGKIVLNEILLRDTSPVCNKSLKEIDIPRDCVITSVIRDEEVIIPNGFTVLQSGDYIVMVSTKDDQLLLKNYFLG